MPSYSRAPITEAIIAIDVRQLPESLLPQLAAMHDSVRADYPVRETFQLITGKIEAKAEDQVQASATRKDFGYEFRTAERSRIFRAKLDGFSFHWLAPYRDWESLLEEARRLWGLYGIATGEFQLASFGVRYINKISVPLGEDLRIYLRTYPELSPDLPQLLNNYLLRAEIPIEDGPGLAVMHQALVPSGEPGLVGVVLDNDFRFELPPHVAEEELWEMIDRIRPLKNSFFEACITDVTRDKIR